jgi:UTP--glucose-1-phosphate uridylyltransferase
METLTPAESSKQSARVEVAVIPVAGLGTRWLPVTRSVPKELLPVWSDAAVSHVVREVVDAGIGEVVFVTSPGKTEVVEHFRRDQALFDNLSRRGKGAPMRPLTELWDQLTIRTAIQAQPLGLGHAVACARELVGERPFALLLPDEILLSSPSPTSTLVRCVEEGGDPAILLMPVDPAETSRYGIAAVDAALGAGQAQRIRALVEKPAPADAPSNLAVIGRYVLTPDIFALLAEQGPGHGGEIQLTDALARLAQLRPLLGVSFEGIRHDVGYPEGLLLASVELALRDDARGPILRKRLSDMIARYPQT